MLNRRASKKIVLLIPFVRVGGTECFGHCSDLWCSRRAVAMAPNGTVVTGVGAAVAANTHQRCNGDINNKRAGEEREKE